MKIKEQNKYVKTIALLIVITLCSLWLIKGFNLSWVEVNDSYAEVTINFLMPMEQEDFENNIKFSTQPPYETSLDYSVTWLTKQAVSIKVKESHDIKGQTVKLYVNKAPTLIGGLTKSAVVRIDFNTPIEVVSPTETLLISSNNSFLIQFNTPMNASKIHKYIACSAAFKITPYTYTSDGKTITDLTKFVFTPKTPLENDQKYLLSLMPGLSSANGTLLDKQINLLLQVDTKPTITKTYPNKGDKWIGLYPRITLESQEPITKAALLINDITIEGTLIDDTHAYFLLNNRLEPNTTYKASFQIQVASGEKSQVKEVEFTTTTLDPNRIWLEVICTDSPIIYCYQGTNVIRTIQCNIGKGENTPPLGTYYLQDKLDVYEDEFHHEGANYWLRVNDQFGFQGFVRDSYWNILNTANNTLGARSNRKNVILSDDDARWLFENLPYQAMIIFKS